MLKGVKILIFFISESDDDDWEGETHVSRVLREHYENHRQPLPDWLLNDDVVKSTRTSRRLWQEDEMISTRQKEILEIRNKNTHTELQNSTSSYALHQPTLTNSPPNVTLPNSQSMPNVRSKSERKPSNFANVTLSMNNSLRNLYPKRPNATKVQYVSSNGKSFF